MLCGQICSRSIAQHIDNRGGAAERGNPCRLRQVASYGPVEDNSPLPHGGKTTGPYTTTVRVRLGDGYRGSVRLLASCHSMRPPGNKEGAPGCEGLPCSSPCW